jgi:hypothetical protein
MPDSDKLKNHTVKKEGAQELKLKGGGTITVYRDTFLFRVLDEVLGLVQAPGG